ncbi:MAG: alpha amylase C-terminal domain-containing protein, partial [Allorhizobium sp.]
DSLHYIEEDPVYRKYHHGMMTFSMVYAYSERFMLPISHDEVVHGKGSLLGKMPGDVWQKHANLRAYYGFMWAHPGKKLLFMGCEIGQETEWNHDGSIVWDLLDNPQHAGVQRLISDLNRIYATEPALTYGDVNPQGFDWAIGDDAENSIFGMLRWPEDRSSCVLAISNMTPMPRHGYRVGVPEAGRWTEILNSDAGVYGGSNLGNSEAWSEEHPSHGKAQSIMLTLPPLSTIFLRWSRD